MSPATIDILRVGIPVGAGAVAYSVYGIINFINAITSQYITKMSYSKDKELVFIRRVDQHGILYEEVYETAHLEIVPPSQKSGVADLSSQDENGLWRITCMSTQKNFLLYNDPNHWNTSLRDEFLKNRMGMWDKSYYGYTRKEAA